MGLIAREIERRGTPTICLSSARSITESVNPPRAVFIDFPLGHTAGKAGDKSLQRRIMIDTLSALDGQVAPGRIRDLPQRWSDSDDWKDTAMRSAAGDKHSDNRAKRHADPQYQLPEDQAEASRNLQLGECPGCVWLSD